jgi:hypothetical protein
MAVRSIEGSGGDRVLVDDATFPFVVAAWEGEATEPAVRAYFVWLEGQIVRAMREKRPLINVTETSKAMNPKPSVRKLIADLTKQWGTSGADRHEVLAYVVVDSAIIRGVLTALGWLHGEMKVTHVATLEAAATSANDALRALGRPELCIEPGALRRPSR